MQVIRPSRWLPLLALLLLVAPTGCDGGGSETAGGGGGATTQASGGSGGGGGMKLAVIPKGTTHVFWKSVEAGARQAAAEAGVDIQWKGPLKENDRAAQIQIVEQFIADRVDGIVLAPLDDTALRRPVVSAMGQQVPVVIFDSALKGEPGKDFVSFVATNNRQGGVLAGEALAEALGGKGKVVLLRYQEGSASTTEREEGFLEVMKKTPGVQVIVDNRFAGATSSEARAAAMDLLDRLKEADGIFCPNEPVAYGMLLALRQNGLLGQKKFVGFDASPQLLEALEKGEIQALVVQNPVKMGYEGVMTMVRHLKGEQVPATVDTGVAVVTKENLKTPDIQELLQSK